MEFTAPHSHPRAREARPAPARTSPRTVRSSPLLSVCSVAPFLRSVASMVVRPYLHNVQLRPARILRAVRRRRRSSGAGQRRAEPQRAAAAGRPPAKAPGSKNRPIDPDTTGAPKAPVVRATREGATTAKLLSWARFSQRPDHFPWNMCAATVGCTGSPVELEAGVDRRFRMSRSVLTSSNNVSPGKHGWG